MLIHSSVVCLHTVLSDQSVSILGVYRYTNACAYVQFDMIHSFTFLDTFLRNCITCY